MAGLGGYYPCKLIGNRLFFSLGICRWGEGPSVISTPVVTEDWRWVMTMIPRFSSDG